MPKAEAYPIVYLQGRFIESADARVSVFDRGFLYGDGLFETIRLCRGRLVHWNEHLDRLLEGFAYLGIDVPKLTDAWVDVAGELIRRNEAEEAVLRVGVSRGTGARGYSTRKGSEPTVVMTLHPAPELRPDKMRRWKCHIAREVVLPSKDSLGSRKTSNKLRQILAKSEAERAGSDEALLVNDNGDLVEATSGNLFWIENGQIHTPPLAGTGILPGITRQFMLAHCHLLGWPCHEDCVRPHRMKDMDGIFITLSSLGVVEVGSIDGTPIASAKRTRDLHASFVHSMLES